MEKSSMVAFCIVAVLFAAVPVWAAFNGGSMVKAGTPEAAKVMSGLEQARQTDRMNAQSYMGGDNRDAGLYYYRKSEEADALLKRLRQGETVSLDDVQRALNNHNAVRYGSNF
jgi:hypothetical protein